MREPAHLPHAKLENFACTYTVVSNFGVHTIASEHTRHASDACHELTFVSNTTCVVYRYSRYL